MESVFKKLCFCQQKHCVSVVGRPKWREKTVFKPIRISGQHPYFRYLTTTTKKQAIHKTYWFQDNGTTIIQTSSSIFLTSKKKKNWGLIPPGKQIQCLFFLKSTDCISEILYLINICSCCSIFVCIMYQAVLKKAAGNPWAWIKASLPRAKKHAKSHSEIKVWNVA